MSTISVTCPCGVQFEREVKRGRPARWCPDCRQVPVSQRVASPEAEATVSESKVSRFGQHDTFSFDQREAIEAGVVEVKARVAVMTPADWTALFPEAKEKDLPFLRSDWVRQQYEAVYAPFR